MKLQGKIAFLFLKKLSLDSEKDAFMFLLTTALHGVSWNP